MANNISQDIRLQDGDLYINTSNGDLDIVFSDDQNIEDIIQSFPGDWKQWPQVGVGVSSYIKSAGKEQELIRNLIVQLKADGFTVDNAKATISDGTITVVPNAYREL